MNLVWAYDLVVSNELPECKCSGRWTWECGKKRSVIDYSLFSRCVKVHTLTVEDEGVMELGSDHNLMWCNVAKPAQVTQQERYKWS